MKTPVASTPPPNISTEYFAEMLLAMEQRLLLKLSAMEGWRTQALEDNNRGNDNKCKNTSTEVDDKEETNDPLAVSDNKETDDKTPTNDIVVSNTDKEETKVVIDPLETENVVSDNM